MDKIVLEFVEEHKTKRTVRFQEVLGEKSWSERDVAIGPLYIQKEALELIGNPSKVKVTIEPVK